MANAGQDRNGGSTRRAERLTVARECLAAMIASTPASMDMAAIDEKLLARRAVAFADALLEALGNDQ